MFPRHRDRRRLSTRVYVFALLAAVVIPLLLFSGFLLTRHAAVERARFEKDALQIARQSALVIDGELQRLLALLRGLSSSTALHGGDLEAFHAQARGAVESAGLVIVLRSLGDRQFLNTQLPFSASLPPAIPIPPRDLERFSAGQAVVSEVYLSPISREPRIAVAMPVLREGEPVRIIAITVPTETIRNVLRTAVPQGWLVGVADRDGTYVTRSERHADVSGKPGLPEYLAKAVGQSGTFTSHNFEGRELLAGYYRSDFSGWLFAANIARATVEAPLWRSLATLSAIGISAAILSALLAYLFGKQFTSAATGLAERARALGEARPVPRIDSFLTEFNVVGDALVVAASAIEEREKERERTIQRDALLGSIFDFSGLYVGVIEILEHDVRYVVANRSVSALYGRAEEGIDGLTGRELGLNSDEIRFRLDLVRRCATAGQPVTTEYGLTVNGTEVGWNLTTISPFPPSPEGNKRVAFTAIDISARKRGEEQRQLLVNELNHRVKNTLASVQAMTAQTLRAMRDPEAARQALTDRLMALSRTHDVLTRESWEGAGLQEILIGTLDAHADQHRYTVEGPSVWLSSALSLSLALSFHELTTNALKYGALSNATGSISVRWELERTEAGDQLRLRWTERGGPAVGPPQREGFGSRLIARSLSTHAGSVAVDYAREGLTCTMTVPLSQPRPPSSNAALEALQRT